MWTYSQTTGKLTNPDGLMLAVGYAGIGAGKNNPAQQAVHNVGPIPQGLWAIGQSFDSQMFGRIVMRLTPAPGTETFGRDGFLIHGDSAFHPGYASHGCIVIASFVRAAMAVSKDRELEVTA